MEAIFQDFIIAQNAKKGNVLASTISPEPPSDDPARLYNFLRSSNPHSLQTDLRYKLQYNPELALPRSEAIAWLEVFTAFYKFVSYLVSAEEATNAGHTKDADWTSVYEGWKEVVNALIRGYSQNLFSVWTIPCLYKAGKYLRVFAIKADENSASQRDSGISYGGIQEEDVIDPASKHEKLEDAARQINRIFSLCVGDRYVLILPVLFVAVFSLPARVVAKVGLVSETRSKNRANGQSTRWPICSSKPTSNSTLSAFRRTFSAHYEHRLAICHLCQPFPKPTR